MAQQVREREREGENNIYNHDGRGEREGDQARLGRGRRARCAAQKTRFLDTRHEDGEEGK